MKLFNGKESNMLTANQKKEEKILIQLENLADECRLKGLDTLAKDLENVVKNRVENSPINWHGKDI